MERYLIINADDFGMCHAGNAAVMELFELGAITSSTIMTPCNWSVEAAQFAKENPQYAIGVHLTLTSEWERYRWSPVNSDNTGSLRNEFGFMWEESDQVEKHADLKELEGEIRAQIARAAAMGLENPSHVDNHMGSLYGIETGRFEMLTLTLDIASEHKLPFRMPRNFTDEQLDSPALNVNTDKNVVKGLFKQVAEYADAKDVPLVDYLTPHDWEGPQKESYENFKEYIYKFIEKLPEGVSEMYIHPVIETDEIKNITGSWLHRNWEYKLFKDPKTREHIEACGIKLINYRDLAKMRRG